VVAHNINNDINLRVVEAAFQSGKKWVNILSWLITSIMDLPDNYTLILFKNVRYSFSAYIEDVLYFALIILLCSILFYYMWFRFVEKILEPVEDNLRDMHDFIHNAWHELKTPISVIHSNLQLLGQEKKLNKALVQEWIWEIDRLNKLIESLIELSSIQHVYTWDKISLKDEIEAIIKEFKWESAKKNVHISFVSQYEKSIYMNKQYFYMLFSNLLGNAIKYTDKDWHIDITLQKSKLIIKDDGIGIPKEDFKKIFNRFYQSSKGRDGSGFGIWLSLVKKIIDIHKMEIHLESDIGKGSIFTIEF
jgi:two-component system phosphate regulon sensor histidine kinase PhoR